MAEWQKISTPKRQAKKLDNIMILSRYTKKTVQKEKPFFYILI